MDQEKLNKLLQFVGELSFNLRMANEEISLLKNKIKEMENKVITNVDMNKKGDNN